MKKILLLSLLFCYPVLLLCQNFTMVSDTTNPIVSEPPNSATYTFAYTGCAWVDVDDDGWVDLFYSGNLYHNEGNAVFTKWAGVDNAGQAVSLTSCSWGDVNRDGSLDVLYSTPTWTKLFTNDGAGNFSQLPSLLDTIDSEAWSAQLCDFNNDGHLDVTLTFADGFGTGHFPVRLFSGSTSGLTAVPDTIDFLSDLHPYTVSYWTDYDLDGDQDLFIASGPGGSPGPDFHYRNTFKESGIAGFERILNLPFSMQAQDGQNYNFIDFDNDNDLDMCLTNWVGAVNRLYRNDGGNYTSLSMNFNSFNAPNLSNSWADFDNDGDLDLITTAGGQGLGAGYYENDGNGNFTAWGNIIQNAVGGNTAGISTGDFDNDGDLDFFTVGKEKGLFRNDLSNGNNWVILSLKGTLSNTSAIGSIVRLKATIDGQAQWLTREISAQNTFMGHNSLRVHFGLGDATIVDSLVINWLSGTQDVFTSVNPSTFYKVTEGSSNLVIQSTSNQKIIAPEFSVFPNPSDGQLTINLKNAVADTIKIDLFDITGKLVMEKKINQGVKLKLDIGHLSKGSYLIRVSTKDLFGVRKIVLK